ncbi:hypothetical protein HPP92_018690 [Vanilla planifolia]|uniref:Uncharacterized protein n=1 Tax=Vanilla planifolia TaxID=51239 RepID=A0A835QKI1_VANPL|nr:hypothetical protein HPP92_019278 [Vanilla planifolia]KAG0469362.1 hypothetical protein HPP92_018690 [Vanilla planifolia]
MLNLNFFTPSLKENKIKTKVDDGLAMFGKLRRGGGRAQGAPTEALVTPVPPARPVAGSGSGGATFRSLRLQKVVWDFGRF